MTTKKKIGIWMDHSEAHLIAYEQDAKAINTISNPFDHAEKEKAWDKSENLMHNKRQQHLAAFYKNIEDVVINYDEALLFGPTDAKIELLNLLQANKQFKDIKIQAIAADKMNDAQKLAFVKEHFSKA